MKTVGRFDLQLRGGTPNNSMQLTALRAAADAGR